ncbi:MAG TPA: hypothetical protein VEJ41_02560 [Candidatus Acidoferrales bacterium]|nr:hypothetical protein [Candidatus Acidoferrales bacterium]
MSAPDAELRPLALDDYERIRQLGRSFALDLPREEDWRRLWLDNPLRERFGDALPLGWALETGSGELVGTMGTVWVPYSFRGDAVISAVSRAWFVKAEFRALGLQLMDEYLHQKNVDLCINTAVSVPAHEAFRRFCEPVPAGQWDRGSYWDIRNDDISASALRQPSTAVQVEFVGRFDARFDDFWRDMVRLNPEKLLADRSLRTLTWHFGSPLRRGRLWILTASVDGRLVAYCTLTRQDDAFALPALAYAGPPGTSSMRVVDYQYLEPENGILAAFLTAALNRCSVENIGFLENLGCGVPKMHALDNAAPHVKALPNWKFYYTATDQRFVAELKAPEVWDPSAYDGDASFE